ncbi:hypothetical protein [Natrinema sp. 1APR25-10V2]|uniref:hypothetical protein n=1 Tax=Natrinema sp. 1APR25-10V2 TaxID=2951081 RepID=UPI00287B7A1C|nr:hypothetical protein [Natrinema sp. 1APR25-10V2]
MAVVDPLILDILGIDSLTVGIPDTFSFLFSFSSPPTEISMSVGPGVLGIGAVVGLIYAFLGSYRRVRLSAGGSRIKEWIIDLRLY